MIVALYILAALGLLFYSFTQIDLNLTLSHVGLVQVVQKTFQTIGYFQRPLSTSLYGGLLLFWFILYGVVLWRGYAKRLSARTVWTTIAAITALLIFSYPAFSYDIYNYLFTAKTVLVYGKNPYGVIPLQFTGFDPWVNFMRWTHLPSAYTPLWIAITLPFFLLGLGYFLPVLLSMKLLVASMYLLACWFLYKSLQTLEPKHASVGLAIFALNPLVVIESLVSAHNDIAMMACAMGSLWFFLTRKKVTSFFFFSVSVGLKLITGALLPVFLVGWNRWVALVLMLAGFLFVIFRREVLPWYWIWIMPFVALLPKSVDVVIVAAGVSLGLLLRYAPYLYLGNWDSPAGTWKLWGTIVPIGVSLVVIIWRNLSKKK